MVTKTQAIKNFLLNATKLDLANSYNHDMEVQVNVGSDGGDRIDGEYKGKRWHGWSDGVQEWKPFRIPYRANSEPEYNDVNINFDLAAHAEGIGMTGWNWKSRTSRWVAFDFDGIVGHSEKHSKKLSADELNAIRDALMGVEWCTIRRSTSGTGLHVYVFLPDVPTNNHNEHASLARAVLAKLSTLVGFDLTIKVDACGGNMWVWHRKMLGTNGLELVKQGSMLVDIPPNWKDHVKVITGKRKRNLPQNVDETEFETLTGRSNRTPLDAEHKRLIEHMKTTSALWWWDNDHHMLITHTIHLKDAHAALNLRGVFDTISIGKEKGQDHNCFLFPISGGAWSVRRYSLGVQEHDSWTKDESGWTKCYFNRMPDLETVSRTTGGLEDPKGGFVFAKATDAVIAAKLLGVELNLTTAYERSIIKLKKHKDGRRLVAEVEYKVSENMPGWLQQKKLLTKVFNTDLRQETETERRSYDSLIRHLVSKNEDAGWVVFSDAEWRSEPKHNVKDVLVSNDVDPGDITEVLGSAIMRPFRIVNKPFESEYPGDREWNRNAAQFRFTPTVDCDNLSYPTWIRVLKHCGEGLDETVKADKWCKESAIESGLDYLKIWIASLFKEPSRPLAYLFFFSPEQNTGKSIFHEALSLLLTKGYQRSDVALTSSSGFNAELEGAILCVVEETDLRKNKDAYSRIKDYVTSIDLLIHPKGRTPYHIKNTTHWVQCDNNHQACPVFGNDTRVTMCPVRPLTDIIPKKQLLDLLEKEAPDFLAEILHLELPESKDRLNVPALATQEKISMQYANRSLLLTFLDEKCSPCDGHMILYKELYDQFILWLDNAEQANWTKTRFSRELPPNYPKGRNSITQQCIGNIKWTIDTDTKPSPKLFCDPDTLYLEVKNEVLS